MQKQGVHDKPVTEEPSISHWVPPQPPSGRERFVIFFERFGFLFACLLTIGILAMLFIRSEVLLREPDTTPSQVLAPAQPASEQVSAPLSITTQPASAAIFIDGEFVGVSPLQEHVLATGAHRISVQKQNYASHDTVLTLAGGPAVLYLFLRVAEDTAFVEESQDQPPPELAADETSQDTQLALEQTAPPEPVPPEEQPAPIPEVTPANPDQVTNLPDNTDTDLAGDDPSDTLAEVVDSLAVEEPIVEMGELRVLSQPSGASVWLGDQQVGVSPLLLTDVEAGAQQVTLRLDGYESFTTTVDVASQQRAEVNGPLTQRLGTLKILAKPWGDIYINGKLHKREASIWYTAKLAPGDYRVQVEHPSLGKWEQVVVVSLEEEGKVEVDFNKGNSPSQ